MLQHTVAHGECTYINANSTAKTTRSFHEHTTKTGSKGENSRVFGNSRALFAEAFLANARENKMGNMKSEHSTRVSRQQLCKDLQVQTI